MLPMVWSKNYLRVRTMARLIPQIEQALNKLAISVDPCEFCNNKTPWGHKNICHECCYFYASKFKVRRIKHGSKRANPRLHE